MSCFIARVPHLSSDIPPSIFHGSIISEFLGIARCTYRLPEFIPRASEIYLKMVAQGGHRNKISQQIKKVFQVYIREAVTLQVAQCWSWDSQTTDEKIVFGGYT